MPQTPFCLLLLFSYSTLHFLKCAYLPPGTPDLWFITRTSHIPHILPALFLSHGHLGISGDLPTLPSNTTTLCLTSLGSHPGQDCRVLRHTVNLPGAATCSPCWRDGLYPTSSARGLLFATSSLTFSGSLQVVPIRGMGAECSLRIALTGTSGVPEEAVRLSIT